MDSEKWTTTQAAELNIQTLIWFLGWQMQTYPREITYFYTCNNDRALHYVVSSLCVKLPENIHPLWNNGVSVLDHTGWQSWHSTGKHYFFIVLMDLLNSWVLTCVFQWIKVSGTTNQRLDRSCGYWRSVGLVGSRNGSLPGRMKLEP